MPLQLLRSSRPASKRPRTSTATCSVSRTGRPPAARLPGLLALRRRRHRSPAGRAQAARRHRGTAPRRSSTPAASTTSPSPPATCPAITSACSPEHEVPRADRTLPQRRQIFLYDPDGVGDGTGTPGRSGGSQGLVLLSFEIEGRTRRRCVVRRGGRIRARHRRRPGRSRSAAGQQRHRPDRQGTPGMPRAVECTTAACSSARPRDSATAGGSFTSEQSGRKMLFGNIASSPQGVVTRRPWPISTAPSAPAGLRSIVVGLQVPIAAAATWASP